MHKQETEAGTEKKLRPPAEIAELRWYYQDSAVELGIRAQNLEAVGGEADLEPVGAQISAARRQTYIRRALQTHSGQRQRLDPKVNIKPTTTDNNNNQHRRQLCC